MQKPRRLAVSYTRFSHAKQEEGDSQTRQDELFRDFCTRHNLTPAGEVYADRGRSGYKDEHRKKGRLGQLIAAAKDGKFEPETVIVVEAWDRLGRLRPDRQIELVAELLRTGVSIGIVRLNDIFEESDFGSHKWTTLAVFIQLAFQESQQKAERLAGVWKRRRERARDEGKLLTGLLPAWLKREGGKAVVIPSRAATVKRIFQMSAEGMGSRLIAATLEREKVPPFGEKVIRKGRSRSHSAGRWTRAYVKAILDDRRALGECQPKMVDNTPDGPPLMLFPKVVTEAEFLLARAGQQGRRKGDIANRRATRQSRHVNVFKNILTDARTGELIHLTNKGTASKPNLILLSYAAAEFRSEFRSFPYAVFEEGVLRLLREIDPADVVPKQEQAPSRVAELRERLAAIREDMAALQGELKKGFSKSLVAVLRDRETAEEETARELQDELRRSHQPAEQAWQDLPGLVEMIAEADDPDAVRLRLQVLLRRLIESALVLIVRQGSWQLCALQFNFAGGGRRDWLLAYRKAGNCRPIRWWARALPASELPDVDLRDRSHILPVTEWLQGVDLDSIQSP
jgi:DNA invertase Pin-like site-specific DNA recombinase